MLPASFPVVLDANVLFPFTLRDTLLRAAAAGYYQPYWSAEILDEMARNLVSSNTTTQEKADRLRDVMARAFPSAMVEGYESLIPPMRNEPKDRHVAAAAVSAHAQVIVTSNLRDFADLPAGIEAKSPDEFLCDLFDLDPDGFIDLLHEQAAELRKPAMRLDEVLTRLERVAPEFVKSVQARLPQ